jgi:predicted RNA-binding Zn-ribbon protein involved in translation (DUF1610 family)
MDEDRKKPVMLVLVVACLALAGGITYWTHFRSSGSSEQNVEVRPVYLKCQSCGYTLETNTNDMWNAIDRSQVGHDSEGMPLYPCPKCGKVAMVSADKCPKCGEIFVPNYDNPRGYPDRCPKCGYSALAEQAKNRTR